MVRLNLGHVGQERIDSMHELRSDLVHIEACEVSFKSRTASVGVCKRIAVHLLFSQMHDLLHETCLSLHRYEHLALYQLREQRLVPFSMVGQLARSSMEVSKLLLVFLIGMEIGMLNRKDDLVSPEWFVGVSVMHVQMLWMK